MGREARERRAAAVGIALQEAPAAHVARAELAWWVARRTKGGADIGIVSKVQLMRAHSVCAEGGTAAMLRPELGDSFELHAWDTVKGSDFLAGFLDKNFQNFSIGIFRNHLQLADQTCLLIEHRLLHGLDSGLDRRFRCSRHGRRVFPMSLFSRHGPGSSTLIRESRFGHTCRKRITQSRQAPAGNI